MSTTATKRCPFCAEEIQSEAIKCKHCGSWLEGAGPGAETTSGHEPYAHAPPPIAAQRLTRSTTDKMVAGVCGGVARYVGMDPTLTRVLVALITFFTGIVPGLVVYIVMALIVPPDNAPPPPGYYG